MKTSEWISFYLAIGALIVTIGTWVGTQYVARTQKLQEARRQAYLEWLDALSCTANTEDRNSEEFRSADIRGLCARHRILLYGTKPVIEALHKLYDGPAAFATDPTGLENYTRLLQAMARDCGATELSKELIETVLVKSGTRPTKAP